MTDDTSGTPSEVYVPVDQSEKSSTASSVGVDKHIEYNYNLEEAPINKKLVLLTVGGIGVLGKLYGDARDKDILGWFPMMARNLEKEREAKLRRGLPI